ncbi:MAG: type II toxin-antitoxin system RelE/ParE family toxin [Methanotrichaceae archaeon]
MSYKAQRSDKFKKMFKDLTKKDPPLAKRLRNKMEDILEHPQNADAKTGNLNGTYGVHVNPYVIIYRIVGDVVEFLLVDHHDKIYK